MFGRCQHFLICSSPNGVKPKEPKRAQGQVQAPSRGSYAEGAQLNYRILSIYLTCWEQLRILAIQKGGRNLFCGWSLGEHHHFPPINLTLDREQPPLATSFSGGERDPCCHPGGEGIRLWLLSQGKTPQTASCVSLGGEIRSSP